MKGTAVVLFSAMNPMTKAHLPMIQALLDAHGDRFIIMPRETRKKGLPYWLRSVYCSAFIHENFPDSDIIMLDTDKDSLKDVLADIYDTGYDSIEIVTDERTADALGKILLDNNGSDFDFSSIKTIPIAFDQSVLKTMRDALSMGDMKCFWECIPTEEGSLVEDLFNDMRGALQ